MGEHKETGLIDGVLAEINAVSLPPGDWRVVVVDPGGGHAITSLRNFGVDYCTVHSGIRNEDERNCDFSTRDLDDPDLCDEDGEPRACVFATGLIDAPEEGQ